MMASSAVTPVVLCGGSGTRLWPLSRAGFPKQFLAVHGESSLFQNTVKRLLALELLGVKLQPCLVVTHEEHRFLASEQLREMQIQQALLLLEPTARNTAAALTLAALQATQGGADSILIASPSDHHVADHEAFTHSLLQAIDVAESGAITILGIKPDQPETGYGYVQFSSAESTRKGYQVLRFVEKPSLDLAQQYLASGDFAWNGGIFVLKASLWLTVLDQFRPDILQACQEAWRINTHDALRNGLVFVRPNADLFAKVPSQSIDYAVMEKCPGSGTDIRMVVLDAGWSDLGAWEAVWQVGVKDQKSNVCHGDVLLDDSNGNLIHASSRLVGVVGVRNLVIVETADAVLIADKSDSQNVKNLVAQLAKSGRKEQTLHRKVHRAWGWSDCLDEEDDFKVKRISVKPGASLSLQRHQHRAEHWIVVEGTAKVTCGDKILTLEENQSTYIPMGESHQLENVGSGNLEIIEVQSGRYLAEDDIVRLHQKDDFIETQLERHL
jgi:mannose-1-phosphate guanylyltransferase / mannose-6-phosphate isomerase